MLVKYEPLQSSLDDPLRWSDDFSHSPIIIDNGASECRAGFVNLKSPQLSFPNYVYKPRMSKSVLVGNEIRDVENIRHMIKSPYLENLLVNVDVQEQIFDYIFSRMSISSINVDHPIVINEVLCNPTVCRSQLTELLFETYGVPKLLYYVDSIASYYHNITSSDYSSLLQKSQCILVSFGHHSTHVIPVLQVKSPGGYRHNCVFSASRRLHVGGAHSTWLIHRLLQQKYPCHSERITFSLAEYLLRNNARTCLNYRTELSEWCNEAKRKSDTLVVQLPYSESSADLNATAERRRAQALRLQDLHRKRQSEQLENARRKLDELQTVKLFLNDTVTSHASPALLKRHLTRLGLASESELLAEMDSCQTTVDRLTMQLSSSSSSLSRRDQVDCEQSAGVDSPPTNEHEVARYQVPPAAAPASSGVAIANGGGESSGRQKRASELLVSMALPAAVQAQLVAGPAPGEARLNDAKLKARIRMAQDLESTKGEDLLAWITSLRHRRLRVARRRTLRQSRIGLATQLGLHADDECQLPTGGVGGEPSRPTGSDHHLSSASTIGNGNGSAASTAFNPNAEHERSSQVEEKGRKMAETVGQKPPLTERRRQQLEKIRALAAELKPSRGSRGRGGRGGGGGHRGNLASPLARIGEGRQQRGGGGGKRRQSGPGRGSGAGSSGAALSVQEDGDTMDSLSSMTMEGGGALLDADDDTDSRLLVDGPGTEGLLDKLLDPDAECDESVNGGSAGPPVSARQTGSEEFSSSRNSSAANTMFASSVPAHQQSPADESEDERDQLAVVDHLLALYDPESCKELGTTGLRAELSQFYQLHVDTELLRASELPFQPSFMGSCEAGLAECFDFVLRDLKRSDCYCSSSSQLLGDSDLLPSVVFLAGGLACLPGMPERIAAELRALLPCADACRPHSELRVVVAENPRMDAWRGARQFVLDSGDEVFTTRQQYDEYGADYFTEHSLSNPFWLKKH